MLLEFERAIALREPIGPLKDSLLAKARNRYEAERREIERSAEAASFIEQALTEPKTSYVYGVARGYERTFCKIFQKEVAEKQKEAQRIMSELTKGVEHDGAGEEESDTESDDAGSDGGEAILSEELPEITP